MIKLALPLAILSLVMLIVSAGKCASSPDPDSKALWKLVFDASIVVDCIAGFGILIFA